MNVVASDAASKASSPDSDAVLAALAALRLPATPRNYEIWYNITCSSNNDLAAKVENRTREGRPLDETFLAELYSEMSGSERQQQQTLSAAERMVRELTEVLSVLRQTGAKADAYAETLQTTSTNLEESLDVRALREIVSGLAAATVDMAEHNRMLSKRLDEGSKEIEGLRTTLHKARAEALTDPLTGLANRKMLSETLHMRVREALAGGTPLCFMMCDIDHFKRFNDTWGHQTGDQIIRFIASTLSRHGLPDFLSARYGGEEFSVVMPRVTVTEAHAFAESVRSAIESKKLFRKSTGEDLGRITMSIGLAQWRGEESVESLIERADACLYASKRGGRNRVTIDRQIGASRGGAAA